MRGRNNTTVTPSAAAPTIPPGPRGTAIVATNGRNFLNPVRSAAPHARERRGRRARRPTLCVPLGGLAFGRVCRFGVDVDDSVRPPAPAIAPARQAALAINEQVED